MSTRQTLRLSPDYCFSIWVPSLTSIPKRPSCRDTLRPYWICPVRLFSRPLTQTLVLYGRVQCRDVTSLCLTRKNLKPDVRVIDSGMDRRFIDQDRDVRQQRRPYNLGNRFPDKDRRTRVPIDWSDVHVSLWSGPGWPDVREPST